jgi:plastocyanin
VIRHLQKVLAVAIGSLPLLAMAGVTPAAAQTAQQSATITISDQGYSPSNVTVVLNGTVSFTNSGSIVHTATTTGGAPLPFDTGGLDPGTATSFTLSLPGAYAFNSATDCLNGNTSATFKCGGGVVTVLATTTAPAAPAAAPAPAAPAPAAAAPAAAPGSPPSSVSINISDKTVTPASATVALGGSVTWTNTGSNVHTATTTGSTPIPFDTGGLGPGQSGTLTFATPGTYTYNSAIDCVNNSNPAGFGCGPYTLIVSGIPAPAAPSSPSASGAPLPVVSNTNVVINDTQGFVPNSLTIRTGQTVTWTNSGNNVHTASSNAGYTPAFDSGGLGNGQKFSFTFTQPGTYGYHSQTEPVYSTDSSTGTVTVTYQFNGTIIVQ